MISAATWPRDQPERDRLLWIDPRRESFFDTNVGALDSIVQRGDLLVVNDAATLPASLAGRRDDGTAFELRLLSQGARGSTEWRAVLFGAGDWRDRTEDRPPPPRLLEGERFAFAEGGRARVLSVDPRSPRLVRMAFESDVAAMWRAVYEQGRLVQYAYIEKPLELWHVQSSFASRPWAVESPSAGRPLTFAVLARLRERGTRVVALTHAAGLSSTGDAVLDALLPLEERYEISVATADAIAQTRMAGGRVVATGTTVVRALEGCSAAYAGKVVPGEGTTDLRLDGDSRLQIVDGLLTGIHERGTTHFELTEAFADRTLLDRALVHAERTGYLQHEFGDSVLILSTPSH
jgi:S-adenosylmethionine:tRNA ribosyltransferase-isomerase